MIYDLLHYQSAKTFNEDAQRRYREVDNARRATSYDSWWTVAQLIPEPEGGMWVLWSRVAPPFKRSRA